MPNEEGSLKEIKNDIFCLLWSESDSVNGGFGANQGFVILEDSVLVFDSGMSMRQASLLDRSVRSLTDKKIRYLVNSHDHSDHVFGNSFFLDRYSKHGLTILAHRLCQVQVSKLGEKRMKNYRKIPDLRAALEPLRIVQPTVTYPDLGLQLEIEGTHFVFAHPATGAHTLGDTYLCLPKERVLFAGDIVWNRFYPNLEDANLEGWIDTLNDLDLATYTKFLPGHGEICGGKQVAEFGNYLTSVRDNLAELESRGKTNDFQAQKSCFELPGTEKWLLESIVEYNINALFHSKE